MKKKDLYLDSGYLNVKCILETGLPFIFVIGGRAIGKTYGFLKDMIENDKRFIYFRRSQVQLEVTLKSELSPFKSLNKDLDWHIEPDNISKYVIGFYEGYQEKGVKKVDKDCLYGYGAALSTFANIRGFDGSDIDYIIFDEFIPQVNEMTMRGEAEAFFNMVETISRNREIKGLKPCTVICLSNANDSANSIFLELGIVSRIMKLQANNEFYYEDKNRGLCVVMPQDSPISKEKEKTSLYKLTKGTSYHASAIGNDFVYNVPTAISSKNLREYRPLCKVGEICIYKHKSNGRIYVTSHMSGNPPCYGSSAKELAIFRRRYQNLIKYVYLGKIDYEDYSSEVIFDKYYNSVYT